MLAKIFLLTAGVGLASAVQTYKPDIVWCNEFGTKGPCHVETAVPLDPKACRPIPDSNAKGDPGSSVAIRQVKAGTVCMTLFYDDKCTWNQRAHPAVRNGDWMNVGTEGADFWQDPGQIYRGYIIWDTSNSGACGNGLNPGEG